MAHAQRHEPTRGWDRLMERQTMKQEDLDMAVSNLDEAADLAEKNDEKANIYLRMAGIYIKRKSYAKAREMACKALQAEPSQSTPYILIANMYAMSASDIYPNDHILAQTVYYAAVDKLEKAKSAEPSKAAEINSMISSYRSRFPNNQDVFMHPDLKKGETITIGGWIQEKTTVR